MIPFLPQPQFFIYDKYWGKSALEITTAAAALCTASGCTFTEIVIAAATAPLPQHGQASRLCIRGCSQLPSFNHYSMVDELGLPHY